MSVRHLESFSLSKADSNHHKQNQNLLCYHYTIGHQYALSGCKGKKYLAYCQIISCLFTFLPFYLYLTISR